MYLHKMKRRFLSLFHEFWQLYRDFYQIRPKNFGYSFVRFFMKNHATQALIEQITHFAVQKRQNTAIKHLRFFLELQFHLLRLLARLHLQ